MATAHLDVSGVSPKEGSRAGDPSAPSLEEVQQLSQATILSSCLRGSSRSPRRKGHESDASVSFEVPAVNDVLSSPRSKRTHLRSASRLSHLSVTTHVQHFASEAITEVAQGLEPIYMVCRKLLAHHRMLLLGCVVLVAIGVAGAMAIEGWDFLTSIYVIIQISTTIGYGEVTVGRPMMQLFMTFYVLATLFLLANFLNIVLRTILERHQVVLLRRILDLEVAACNDISCRGEARRRFRQFNEVIVAGIIFFICIMFGTVFYRFAENCNCSYGVTQEDFGLTECNPESYETCVATGGLTQTWVTAFYMSVITVTTVGFGDYTPKTVLGRSVGIFWMLIGVSATAYFMQCISKVVSGDPMISDEMRRRRTSQSLSADGALPAIESLADIDRSVFDAMDIHGNGKLSKAEYTRYVLVKHNVLPIEVLRLIDEKFDSIDKKGTGSVSYDMIEEVARRRAVGTCSVSAGVLTSI